MDEVADVAAWRAAERARLIAARVAVTPAERRCAVAAVSAALRPRLAQLPEPVIGFYWPFRGELDLRGLVEELCAGGAVAALPVVTCKAAPLQFWRWRPGAPLDRGVWNIPIPARRDPITPSVLLVPLVGFDANCYRLGYGGGYYDRTLAACKPRPLAIGVGFARCQIGTIRPQLHDVPMDEVITEAGTWRRNARS